MNHGSTILYGTNHQGSTVAFMGLSWYLHGALMEVWCSMVVYALPLLPWCFQEKSIAVPRYSHGASVVVYALQLLPWDFHGASRMRPWSFHGTPMLLSRCFHGTPMALSRCFHGTFIVLPRCFHGTSMGFSWSFHRTFMVLDGTPRVLP